MEKIPDFQRRLLFQNCTFHFQQGLVLSSHSWREKGLVCTPCRLPELTGFLHCVFIPPGKVSPGFFCLGDVDFPHLSTCSWNCSLPESWSAQILSRAGKGTGEFQSTPDRRVEMILLFSTSFLLQIRAFQDKLTQS